MECATGKGKLLLFYKISTRLAGAMEKEVGEESKKKKVKNLSFTHLHRTARNLSAIGVK